MARSGCHGRQRWTLRRTERLGLALAALLLVGCPPSEEEQRRAAVSSFLSSEPTPSSLAVLQPGATAKLAEFESSVIDDGERDRLVKALVLIDDPESHELLLHVLAGEPQRTNIAFATARQYQKLATHLDLLYDRLTPEVRQEVFCDVCWPAFDSDGEGVLDSCIAIWIAENDATRSRWLRLFTHAGPQDSAAPYRLLAEGLEGEAAREEIEAVATRIAGGEVIPESRSARDAMKLTALIAERDARLRGGPGDHLSVAFEGGYVEVTPSDPDSDFGRTGHRLLADLPMHCLTAWGAGAIGERLSLEVTLKGSKLRPEVGIVGLAEPVEEVSGGIPGEPAAPPAQDPTELMRACLEIGLAEVHARTAPWTPRFGKTRFAVRSVSGESWDELAEGRLVLSSGELRTLADKLRESGTPAWRARLEIAGREEPPLRDLGTTDLGFCLAYVSADWADCATWLGEMATVDVEVDDMLRKGLRDADPRMRGLCRVALSVSLDDEGLEEAAQPPPAEESADPPTEAAAGETTP